MGRLMRAMVLTKLADLNVASEPAAGEVRIRVATCGVCHTELDEI